MREDGGKVPVGQGLTGGSRGMGLDGHLVNSVVSKDYENAVRFSFLLSVWEKGWTRSKKEMP